VNTGRLSRAACGAFNGASPVRERKAVLKVGAGGG
jgi:hypothetical protein